MTSTRLVALYMAYGNVVNILDPIVVNDQTKSNRYS